MSYYIADWDNSNVRLILCSVLGHLVIYLIISIFDLYENANFLHDHYLNFSKIKRRLHTNNNIDNNTLDNKKSDDDSANKKDSNY